MNNVIDYPMNEDFLNASGGNGIISMEFLQKMFIMNNKKKDYLAKHEYKVWQGKDGKWYTYLPDKEKGRKLIKRTSEKDVADVIIKYYKQQEIDPTVSEVFDEWNDRRLELKQISPGTHLRNKQMFNRHFTEMGKRRISTVSKVDWLDFFEEQIPKYEMTAKAFSGLKGITKGLLSRAKRKELIDLNILELMAEVKGTDASFKKIVKEDYQEVFNDVEMQKMMTYLQDNLDTKNIGIMLMFVTGIRVGELVALKHSDFSDLTVKIRRTESRRPKSEGKGSEYVVKEFPKTGAGVRTVVIPEGYIDLVRRISLLNPFSEYIFCNEQGERYTTNAIRRRLEKICKTLGIFAKSPHKIRKTYGTILLDNHVDNRLVIDQMGHTDINCTEGHYHRNRKTYDKKAEIINSIPEFSVAN